VSVRSLDFVDFELTSAVRSGAPLPLPPGVFATGAKLEKLATDFSNASGLTTDAQGQLFFTDAAMHKIYRWNASTHQADLLTDKIQSPMALGFIPPGSLLAIDYSKAVYSVDPNTGTATKLDPASTALSDASLLLPTGIHNSIGTLQGQVERRGVVYAPRSNMAIVAKVVDEPRGFYCAPGTHTAVMAGGNWQPELQASQWSIVAAGAEHLVASEEDDTVARIKLPSLSSIDVTEFAPHGGSSAVSDTAGNVYVASGQVYIYNAAGKQIGVLEIPERPSSLAFGADRRTLFIGARSSLFAIRTQAAGQ